MSPASPGLSAEDRLRPAADHVAARVEAGRIPGAALGLVTAEGERAVQVFGGAQIEPEERPLARETWFDLASLTKVIFTTERILALAEEGTIDLDAPLASVMPDLRQYDYASWIRRITFRDCLGHRTALPAVHPIYTYGTDPETLRAFVLQRDWPAGPPVYSDINYILLGIAIERLAGCRLRELDPGAGFTFAPPSEETAATERCTWRGRVMRGEVHDENCYALQGSGHAGLFGTIDGVLNYAAGCLGQGPEHPTRQKLSPTRTHGWEVASPGWSGGDATSAETIGHTGFTGTGLWIDYARGHAWSLLTNRVHPSRFSDSGIFELRRAVGDLISEGA